MVRSLVKLSFAVLLAVYTVPAQAVEVINNGNFESGLTGWTGYITALGTISPVPGYAGGTPNLPVVNSFDVSGSGASNALVLNAGANPSSSTREGGGVTQTFTTTGGIATFSADIAAFTRVLGDGGLGLLSVLLDGVVLDSHDFGAADGPITFRSELDFTVNLAAGTHTIALQSTRLFAPASGVRSQYFDNVSLDVTAAVPEPSTWAMMILGFAGVGFMTYRRRKTAALAA